MGEDCFTEEHQLLTERGFMFLHEIEALPEAERKSLRFAGYDHNEAHLLYEVPNKLVVKERAVQTMIEINQGDE